jgi:hypothetical protein
MDLQGLINDEKTKKTAAESAIQGGIAARSALASVVAILDSLESLQATAAAAAASATTTVTEAQATGTTLGGDVTTLTALLTAQLGATKLTKLADVVAADLPAPISEKYETLVGDVSDAEGALATAAGAAATARLVVARKRAEVDLALGLLTDYVGAATRKLERARSLILDAGARARAKDAARAWWSLERGKALLDVVKDLDPADLLTALTTACDDYADALDKSLEAEDDLAKARTAVATAAAAVESAETLLGQLLTDAAV